MRSFKIKTNWSRDAPSQASTIISSQESSTDHPRTQDLSPIPPTPDQLPTDSSIASKTRYSVLKPAMISMSNASHLVEPQGTSSSPCIKASPEGVLPDPIHLPTVTHLRTPEESPSSIVLESPPAELQTDKVANDERTPSPSKKSQFEKTPLSGPGPFKAKRGTKRTRADAESMTSREKESLENEYRENNFVRLFNADQGRKKSMSEITDLDVILTAIEEEALDIRNDMKSSAGKQAVKEFFIQIRKSFSDTIDIYKENHMLKSDIRKAKSKINKLRKELLSVQQKRSRISAKVEKEKNKLEESNDRQTVLEDFSSFLVKLEALQKECRKDVSSKKTSKLDYGSYENLPSLLIEGSGLLTAVSHLKSVNNTVQQKQ